MRHVGQELRLVTRGYGELLRLLFDQGLGPFDFEPALLHFGVLLRQLASFLRQLLVGALQLVLLALQLGGEGLRLLQQILGAAVRLDRVEHDADALRELVEKVDVGRAERLERRKLDDSSNLAFEEDRELDDVRGRRLAERRGDLDVILWDVRHDDSLLLERALAHQAFAEGELHRDVLALLVGIGGLQRQVSRRSIRPDHAVEDAVLSMHQRRQLGQDHLRDGHQVTLALQHAGEPSQVGLQPVLLVVLLGRVAKVADHLVDVVLEVGDLALRVDPNRPREVTLRHGSSHLRDGTDLGRQSGRQLVHVVGQVAPRA